MRLVRDSLCSTFSQNKKSRAKSNDEFTIASARRRSELTANRRLLKAITNFKFKVLPSSQQAGGFMGQYRRQHTFLIRPWAFYF